jgi:protein tyrosine/serine phosphatase
VVSKRNHDRGSPSYFLRKSAFESPARQDGVLYYDYGISANHEVDDTDIRKILAVIRAAPKPLLIHCKAGSDRTGHIAALYLHGIEGVDAQKASRELYGHFPYLWSNADAMDRTFWRYVAHHRQ